MVRTTKSRTTHSQAVVVKLPLFVGGIFFCLVPKFKNFIYNYPSQIIKCLYRKSAYLSLTGVGQNTQIKKFFYILLHSSWTNEVFFYQKLWYGPRPTTQNYHYFFGVAIYLSRPASKRVHFNWNTVQFECRVFPFMHRTFPLGQKKNYWFSYPARINFLTQKKNNWRGNSIA